MSSSTRMLFRLSLCAVVVVASVLVTAYPTEHYRPYRRVTSKFIGLPLEKPSYRSSVRHIHQQQLYFYPDYRHKPLHVRPKPVYSSKLNRPKKYYKSSRYEPKIVKVPVRSRHQIHYRDYPAKPVEHVYYPQMIEVSSPALPVNIVFRSTSSKINIKQVHQPALYQDNHKNTYSVDEAHVLKHTITKPVISLVKEIIQPKRTVTQVVNPVVEEIVTKVATDPEANTFGQRLNTPQVVPVVSPVASYEPQHSAMSYHLGASLVGPLADYATGALGPLVPASVYHESSVIAAPVLAQAKSEEVVKTNVIDATVPLVQSVDNVVPLVQPAETVSPLVQPVDNVVPLVQPVDNVVPLAQPVETVSPLVHPVSSVDSLPEVPAALYEPHIDLQKIHPVATPVVVSQPQPSYPLEPTSLAQHQVAPPAAVALPTAEVTPINYQAHDGQLLDTYQNFAKLATEDITIPLYQASSNDQQHNLPPSGPVTLADTTY